VTARPVSFLYDVLPAVSRAGCNQGTCHGNSEGRGGLRLSLKGEDPAGDYEVLARHGGGRRVNPADPGRSLLLLKASSTVAHGGGLRLRVGSPEYRALAAWIAEGARFDAPSSPRLVSLQVAPAEKVLVEPERAQQLTVRARFSDGSTRNVTTKAVYNPGDPTIAVSPDGKVTFDRSGDLAVLVRYADGIANARLTYVPARKAFRWKPVPANNRIDEINYRRLKTLRLEPSPLSSDTEFLRRAYLDALGTLPTPEEVRAFLAECETERQRDGEREGRKDGPQRSTLNAQRSPLNARQRLIDDLLERPEFVDFWTMKWADVLRVEERTLDPKGAQGYRDWIRTSVASNKPLDRFARELLTASGSTYSNPPANYYRRTRSADELAENSAQVFMGTRLLCAKCHNHPFERWKQDDYYALAAFFTRVDRKIDNLTRRDIYDLHERNGEEFIGIARQGEVKHPRTAAVVPALLSNEALGVRLQGDDEDRRIAFAEWLTRPDNPFFARAMANRVWYHLLGKGIVDPVDDLRESNPPANPELLDALAKELVARGFDFKHLVRTIMNSRTYQLSSEPNATNADDERFFSRGIAQRLAAEVLLDAISQAAGAPESFPNRPQGTRAINLIPVNKRKEPFLTVFGQPARESACECERTNETTLGQSFALISGASIDAKLKRPDNRIGRMMEAGRTDAEIVTELYLATVSREPTAAEREKMVAYVTSKPDRRAALEDALWALINSKEFLLRR
jgi:hypothetical protein